MPRWNGIVSGMEDGDNKKYIGLRSEDDSETILKDIAGYFSEYQEASRVFNAGDYKKADKLFESTIRNHGKYLPCEEAYFGRAMCDYNRNKWSSAIEGFAQGFYFFRFLCCYTK